MTRLQALELAQELRSVTLFVAALNPVRHGECVFCLAVYPGEHVVSRCIWLAAQRARDLIAEEDRDTAVLIKGQAR